MPHVVPLQATLSGVLTAGMFYFISAAKPLEELSATRPHPTIFCVYFFASLLGQFALQLSFLIFMYRCGWSTLQGHSTWQSQSHTTLHSTTSQSAISRKLGP